MAVVYCEESGKELWLGASYRPRCDAASPSAFGEGNVATGGSTYASANWAANDISFDGLKKSGETDSPLQAPIPFCPPSDKTFETLQCGDVIGGKYKIIGKLREEGFYVAWLVSDLQLGTLWVLNALKAGMDSDKRQKMRGVMMHGANTMRLIDHPCFARIVDIKTSNEEFYTVTEYFEGDTLDRVMRQQGSAFPEYQVVEWGIKLCDALEYLHSKGIIYRNLKPSNVLLMPNNEIKLIEVSLPYRYRQDNREIQPLMGTNGYASPEQFTSGSILDQRCDIYSLGVTLFCLATGTTPGDYGFYATLPPIREVDPSISESLERILSRAMRANPDDRYQRCSDMCFDFVIGSRNAAETAPSAITTDPENGSGLMDDGLTRINNCIGNALASDQMLPTDTDSPNKTIIQPTTANSSISYESSRFNARPVNNCLSAIDVHEPTCIGSILNRHYRVIDKIGEGGSTVIWLASDLRQSKLWAIKEVEAIVEDEIIRRLDGWERSETSVMRNLEHQALPRIVDIFENSCSLFFVMVASNPLWYHQSAKPGTGSQQVWYRE